VSATTRLARVFPGIAEARPIWQLFASAPATALLFSGSVILAVVVTTALTMRARGAARQDWLILLLMLGAAVLMLMLQVRSARLAAILALPAAAWLVTIALKHARTHIVSGLAALAVAWIAAAPLVQFVLLSLGIALWPPAPGAASMSRPSVATCRMADAYTQLAALPPGIVAAPVTIASHVLRYTPHAIVSAGFHRNGIAVIDNLDFFEADDERAREIAMARGITYAVTCGEDAAIPARPWVHAIPSEGPLQVYRLAP
jgi:phosphoglycerol transferase MdoB-like AlkP superfamily enzyme